MADEAKTTLVKIKALQEKLAEIQEQERAIVAEMGHLLAGGPGIGALLKRLEAHFSECWQVRYRAPYVFTYSKDRPQLKRLIGSIGVDELEHRMLRYLRNEDPFFMKARHAFGAFVSSVNQHTDPDRSRDSGTEIDLLDEARATSDMLSTMRASQTGAKK